MNDPLLYNGLEHEATFARIRRLGLKGILTLCPIVIGTVTFGLFVHSHSMTQSIHKNQHTLFEQHDLIIQQLEYLHNETITDDSFTHEISEKLDNLYAFAKVICELYPDSREYCKLLD